MVLGLAVVAQVGAGGCAPKKKPASKPAVKPVGPPILDGRRGGGAFPIESKAAPATPAQLTVAIESGYRKRLKIPTTQSVATRITAPRDDRLDQVQDLLVDVSEWTVDPDFEPTRLGKETVRERTIRARRVSYKADPIHYRQGSLSVSLEAKNAELTLLRDRAGTRGLVMTGAEQGSITFHADIEQFRRTMEAAAKKAAAAGGANVNRLELELASDGSKSLAVKLVVRGNWLLFPMVLKMTGRMDVDEEFYASFSNMSVTGEGTAGEFIAPLLDEQAKKFEERRSQVIAFLDGKTKPTDFQIRLTPTDFSMEVDFARP